MPLQSVQVYNILRSKDFSDEEAQLIAEAIDHKENREAGLITRPERRGFTAYPVRSQGGFSFVGRILIDFKRLFL